jgi:cobalt-zinc-cadmium efflux system protein
MSHTHPAAHGEAAASRRILFAMILTASFMIVEVIGGVLSGSLALLADAGHMLTDSMALCLAWAAFLVSERPADQRRSFGYHRLQILAAFVNGLTLLFIVGWILLEAVRRMLNPVPVAGDTMLVVAALGLIVNLISFWILHGGDQENLNLRGAALHVLGDLLGSLVAIVAALVIIFTGWTPIDPILSVIVAALILRSAWELVKRSAHILLEGSPDWLDVDQLQADLISSIDGLEGLHHLHVWSLTPQRLLLTMHAEIADGDGHQERVLLEIKAALRDRYGINHSTIQVDISGCADHVESDAIASGR